MCGVSATNSEHVERLLDGAEPDLMVTDPPYGVNYDSMWRGTRSGRTPSGGSYGKSANDDQSNWQAAYALFPGRIAYVWDGKSCPSHWRLMGSPPAEFIPRSLIIWDKGRIVFGRGHYHWRHESCWYAVKKGAQANWNGDRSSSTVWEIPNPTQKLIGNERATRQPEAGRVYAAGHPQPQGRRLRSVRRFGHDGHRRRAGGAQLSTRSRSQPAYVDVTVKRWEDFTGRKATRKR